jgi:hypothetical protein
MTDSKEKVWINIYLELKDFKLTHNRYPKRDENKKLANWLVVQRNKFKAKTLSENKIKKLREINFVFDGNQKYVDKWKVSFNQVKFFHQENNRFPSFYSQGLEKKLYNWCQNQRQRYSGTSSGGRTGPLEKWKIIELESINFMFSLKEEHDQVWNEKYEKISKLIKSVDLKNIQEIFKIHRWLTYQLEMNEIEKLDKYKKVKLENIGLDFSKNTDE